jgi:hypothetical protein
MSEWLRQVVTYPDVHILLPPSEEVVRWGLRQTAHMQIRFSRTVCMHRDTCRIVPFPAANFVNDEVYGQDSQAQGEKRQKPVSCAHLLQPNVNVVL